MKRFLSLIFLCAVACLSTRGQVINNPLTANLNASSTDCSVANSCAWQLVTMSAGQSVVTLAGSFSGTFLVEQTNNGTTWTTAATLTSAGTTTYNQNGFTAIRVRCSAYTSGTAVVSLSTGTGGSSGGGSSGVTPGQPAILGAPGLPATSNLIALNNFLDGSGTVMTDSSGSGNTCTLGASTAAPTVNSVASGGGLTFNSNNSQFCAWPSAMNAAKTFVIAMSFQQGVGTLPTNETAGGFFFNTIVAGSSAIANSLDWMLYNNYNTDTWAPGTQGASHFRTLSTVNSTFNSSSACNFLGTGVVALSLAAPDTFYINGIPCVLRLTGSSVGQQTAGVLQLGGSSTAQPFGGLAEFFNGTMYCVAAWNIALTAPQVAQASQSLQSSCLTQRGITAQLGGAININAALQDNFDSNVLEGDSLFAGINIPAQGITGALVSTSDTAIAGTGTWGILSRFGLDDATLYRPGANRNTFIEWAGTNDLAAAPINVVGNLCGTARLAEQVGFNTYFATMISRASQEPFRDNLNPLIRQYIPSCARTYTGIMDLGANTHLGCDGCQSNGTYYTDGIHLTAFASVNIVGPYYVFAFNRENGNRVGAANYNIYTGTGFGIPTLMQSQDCFSLSGLSVTCTLPWNTTAGSLITVTTNCVSCASSTVNTPSDSQALAWTSITAANTYTGTSIMRAAFAPNSTAAAETVTQTLTGGAPSNIFITVQEWSGVLTAAPLDVSSAIATGTSASPLTAAVTTTVSGDLLFGYGATFATNATPAFTPYGTYWQPTSPLALANDAIPMSASYRVTGAAGNYTTGATINRSTAAWGAGTAAFKPTTATSTFQLQAQDIYAECAPNGTNNVVLILPDGTPMTGGTITIKNNQTAGAATCVVNAPTPYATGVQQTIDGATSVTIANKATAVFKSKYSFTGTAGTNLVPVITWEQLQNN